jgi:hypothetical protein
MSPPHQQLPPFQKQQYYSSGLSPQSSAAPLIPADQRQFEQDCTVEDVAGDIYPKTGRRRLAGSTIQEAQYQETLGQSNSTRDSSAIMSDTSAAMPGALPPSPLEEPPAASYRSVGAQSIPVSLARQQYNSSMTTPPSSRLRSSSPRLHSPASSEIFERNVQEPVPISTLQNELSPAHIPNHVLTEDHIPAALEASAEAITSSSLNADEVEIVTATSHQPAAVSLESSIAGDMSSSSHGHAVPSLMHRASEGSEPASLNAASSGFFPLPTNPEDESANSYGALDPNDVRRLSFISFADVVHSEHAHPTTTGDIAGSRDSLHISSLPSAVHDRTASPLRTPRSPSSTYSGGVITPPLTLGQSNQMSLIADQSPIHSPQPGTHRELTIETMRQAVRKTASGDLSGVRSAGLSPVTSATSEDAFARESRSRTNT